MEISKAAIGIVASVSLVAGAGGAWLATRGHDPAPTTVQQAPPATADSAASSTGVEQYAISSGQRLHRAGGIASPLIKTSADYYREVRLCPGSKQEVVAVTSVNAHMRPRLIQALNFP